MPEISALLLAKRIAEGGPERRHGAVLERAALVAIAELRRDLLGREVPSARMAQPAARRLDPELALQHVVDDVVVGRVEPPGVVARALVGPERQVQ